MAIKNIPLPVATPVPLAKFLGPTVKNYVLANNSSVPASVIFINDPDITTPDFNSPTVVRLNLNPFSSIALSDTVTAVNRVWLESLVDSPTTVIVYDTI